MKGGEEGRFKGFQWNMFAMSVALLLQAKDAVAGLACCSVPIYIVFGWTDDQRVGPRSTDHITRWLGGAPPDPWRF